MLCIYNSKKISYDLKRIQVADGSIYLITKNWRENKENDGTDRQIFSINGYFRNLFPSMIGEMSF